MYSVIDTVVISGENVCCSVVFCTLVVVSVPSVQSVVCINGRRYVCCSKYYVASNECDEPTPAWDGVMSV